MHAKLDIKLALPGGNRQGHVSADTLSVRGSIPPPHRTHGEKRRVGGAHWELAKPSPRSISLGLFCRQHPLDIPGDQIHFEIDAAAWLEAFQRGHCYRVRNQVDREFGARDCVGCQADAINAN